jgi:hypothetical protein
MDKDFDHERFQKFLIRRKYPKMMEKAITTALSYPKKLPMTSTSN